MVRLGILILLVLLSLLLPTTILANNTSFVSVVNPIRGEDFLSEKFKPSAVVSDQSKILSKYNIPTSWLIRFDALRDPEITSILKSVPGRDEKGLFLEITPTWTKAAGVQYHSSSSWHAAGSVFLTGYSLEDRAKLIDTAFKIFNQTFGFYPKSVGAWWIDSYTLSYMQTKYKITNAMIVADQYTTDNYQIWGQYWSTPYYPSKKNALFPAQNIENKIPVVILQWAARDPVNAYGNGVEESTYSVQANDYTSYHNLGADYFSRLIDLYTTQKLNQFGYLIVGLENSYDWNKYKEEYENQIKILSEKRKSNQLSLLTTSDFASWYTQSFPKISPEHILIADDPLGSNKKTVWFMNPYYRAGWFFNNEGSVFRDIRQYIDGQEELCYQKLCSELNFATFSIRVLDDVTYKQKWILDNGKIKDLSLRKENDRYVLTYHNESGTLRHIEFLPRDISIDGKIYTIDAAIMAATSGSQVVNKDNEILKGKTQWGELSVRNIYSLILSAGKFIVFTVLMIFLSGFVLIKIIFRSKTISFSDIFLASSLGIVVLTLTSYLSFLVQVRWLTLLQIPLFLLLFISLRLHTLSLNLSLDRWKIVYALLILSGTIFQLLPVFRSGLVSDGSMGFWGPNAHDGVWHIALANQLIFGLPPQNPILAGEQLTNYHYFYDLLIAVTHIFSRIPINDLVFRFYPLLFSLLLGVGTYSLVSILINDLRIYKTRLTIALTLYLVYFAGSFGFIVNFLKDKVILAGESAFWANQPISFNLNPPFAVSLILLILLFHLLHLFSRDRNLTVAALLTIVSGSLVEFKAYASILALGSMAAVSVLSILIKKNHLYLGIFILSVVFTVLILYPNYQRSGLFTASSNLFIWSPLWFVHSMIDSPDRVGWARLSLARYTAIAQGQLFKFFLAEILSLAIFIVGNLGVRTVGLFFLRRNKVYDVGSVTLYIFFLSCFSVLLPLLLIQSGNPWNTIQFFYYAIYTSAIFAGVILSELLARSKKAMRIALICLLLLAPISAISTAKSYLYPLPHAKIDREEMVALDFLAKQPQGNILTYPYDKSLKGKYSEPLPLYAYETTAYIPAFTKKPVFVSDEIQNNILGADYLKRVVASKDFFKMSERPEKNEDVKKFLSRERIRYIYVPTYTQVSLNEDELNIKKIFENRDVMIYQVQDQMGV